MPSLDVNPDGVRAAGATAGAASVAATPPLVSWTPCAADGVSVAAASRLAAAVGDLHAATAAVQARSTAAADHLVATADTYAAQDVAASAVLASTGPAGGGVVPVPAMAAVSPPPVAMTGTTAVGAEPVTGEQASMLIHSGPGADSADAAARALDRHAADLDEAAGRVAAGRSDAAAHWSSVGAQGADTHLRAVQAAYAAQAQSVRALAAGIRAHADDYRRAKSVIPAPAVFADLDQRLRLAIAANNRPPTVGAYAPAITTLQARLAEANYSAMAGYGAYRAAAVAGEVTDPPTGPNGTGAAPPDTAAGADAREPEADLILGPDGQPLGIETDTAGLGDLEGDLGAGVGVGEDPAAMLTTVMPALLGGVSGLLGGVLGGLQAATQGVQQVGTQLLSGVTQAAAGAAAAQSAGDLGAEIDFGTGDFGDGGDFGGGGGGDFGGGFGGGDFGGGFGGGDYGATTPASLPNTPGTFPAGTPTIAAPATFTGTPAGSAVGPGGYGAGMVPPMMPMGMGGAGGAGAGAEDKRLYPERRLRVESPPNAEPVKGRREARKSRAGGAPTDDEVKP